MQSLGGLRTALQLWELALVPSLMNNAETWVELPSEALGELEELQDMFLRLIFQVPS